MGIIETFRIKRRSSLTLEHGHVKKEQLTKSNEFFNAIFALWIFSVLLNSDKRNQSGVLMIIHNSRSSSYVTNTKKLLIVAQQVCQI